MTVFRVALLLLNAALFAWLGYYVVKDPRHGELLGYAVLICLPANCLYLLLDRPSKARWRAFRIMGLWLDAKESELRGRAQKAQENSN
jgi:hypothetical protein